MSKDNQTLKREISVLVDHLQDPQTQQRSSEQELKSSYNELTKFLQPIRSHFGIIQKSYLKEEKKVLEIYDSLPLKLTKFKRDHILPHGNENKRMIILGFSSLASVLVLRKFVPTTPLSLARNAIIAYFGLGLVLAPEIYNPYIVSRPWDIRTLPRKMNKCAIGLSMMDHVENPFVIVTPGTLKL